MGQYGEGGSGWTSIVKVGQGGPVWWRWVRVDQKVSQGGPEGVSG